MCSFCAVLLVSLSIIITYHTVSVTTSFTFTPLNLVQGEPLVLSRYCLLSIFDITTTHLILTMFNSLSLCIKQLFFEVPLSARINQFLQRQIRGLSSSFPRTKDMCVHPAHCHLFVLLFCIEEMRLKLDRITLYYKGILPYHCIRQCPVARHCFFTHFIV